MKDVWIRDGFTVRSLLRSDALSIQTLQNTSTSRPWTLDESLHLIEDLSISGWGIFQDAQCFGILLVQVADIEGDILEFVIDEKFRDQGLGTLLYMEAERTLSSFVIKLFLEVSSKNLGAQNFYEKQGFSSSGIRRNYYRSNQGKVDAILMVKQLKSS